jgi:hypothetical protein
MQKVIIILLIIPWFAWAQQDEIQELKKEIEKLRKEIEELKEQGFFMEEELELLEERLEKRLEELDIKIGSVARIAATNVLNPRITVFGNFAGRLDDNTLFSEQNIEIDDRVFLRSGEIDLRAAVDPYAEGVFILALESEAGEGFEAEIEEGYVIIKKLPLIEEAPLGMKLKAGRFRPNFGVSNKLHMHDMPHITRPLPVAKYLGTEQGNFFESGFNTEGVDAEFILPSVVKEVTPFLNFALVNAGDTGVSQPGTDNPAFFLHLTLFANLKGENYIYWGFSGYHEQGDYFCSLAGVDFTYMWKPLEKGQWRSIIIGGEALYATVETPDNAQTPFGWYGYLQYQINWNLYLGIRYEWVEEIEDDGIETKRWGLYATYYTSEFLRFRLGYEHQMSDIKYLNHVNSLLIEINFVYGAHPVEPYWVHR